MMCVLIFDSITGKNYDLLKLGYFSCFLSVGSKFE